MRGGYRPGAGRKQGFAALEAEQARIHIAEKLKIVYDPIINKAITQAKQGDRHAREWLYNRAFGRVWQSEQLLDNETNKKFIIVIDDTLAEKNSTLADQK